MLLTRFVARVAAHRYLYDLLTNKSVVRLNIPIAIACNKRDLAGAADLASINKLLLGELCVCDVARRSLYAR